MDRRQLLAALGLVGVAPWAGSVWAQPVFAEDPFSLGVASGEPTSDGFVIWTRLAPQPLELGGGMPMQRLAVQWQVATDRLFRTIVAQGEEIARPELGHSIHAEVTGLQPDRRYWYRFNVGGERSRVGQAKTLVRAGAPLSRVRLISAGCQDWQAGLYTAWGHAAQEEDVDFIFHYGDYIYENRGAEFSRSRDGASVYPTVRRYVGDELFSIDDYRRRYAQTKADLNLQAAHASAPFFHSFDDHEVDNDWTGEHDANQTPAEVFALRRAMAFQAWWENMPVRRALLPTLGRVPMHRSVAFGDLMRAHVLDTRQYRTPQPCGAGFAPGCPDVRSPNAQVLGADEEGWLTRSLGQRGARWNLLAQQVMVTALDRRRDPDPAETQPILNLDSWAGYEAPRRRLLEACARAGNAVILTGDEHQNFVNEPRLNDRIAATEFVATSISSGGDGRDMRRGGEAMLARNPDCRFMNDQRGYLLCEVTPDAWTSRFRVVERVTTPGAAIATRASWAVAPGRPGAQPA